MKNFQAGHYVNQGSYKSFQPSPINRQWEVEDMELVQLLGKANRELGRLDMYSEHTPNIELFISMHVLKEATQSSKIEGTKTNIKEALLDKEDISEEKRDDWEEVQNYITALNAAINELDQLPFSSRLIKNTHRILLKGVRGKNKLPGEYRRSQNWIGGFSIKEATFVPPIHNTVHDYLGDLENFVHNETFFFPDLLKIALTHYQFETIHPFLDGNGRVGRLLISLLLVEKGLLKKPVLYLSDFFERNRMQYYDCLMRVREKSDLTQWFKFFLRGVISTAKNGISTFDNILKLQTDVNNKLQGLGARMSNAHQLINYLYQHPIVSAQKAQTITQLSLPSVYKLLAELEELDLLVETTQAKRNRLYLFRDYLDLFR
jgi:Fic family protein